MGVEVDQKSIKGALKDDNAEKLSNETKVGGIIVHLFLKSY